MPSDECSLRVLHSNIMHHKVTAEQLFLCCMTTIVHLLLRQTLQPSCMVHIHSMSQALLICNAVS